MSTPNFYKRDSSKYFVISEENLQNRWQVQDLVSLVANEIERYKQAEVCDPEKDIKEQVITAICKEIDGDIIAKINLTLNPGYYVHANLDYKIDIYAKYDYLPKSKQKIIDKWIDTWTKRIEKIYTKYSDTILVLEGVFSNGEAIYKKAAA